MALKIDVVEISTNNQIAALDAVSLNITNKLGKMIPVHKGLHIKLSPTNSKTWYLRYKSPLKGWTIKGLGKFPEIKFEDALKIADKAYEWIDEGIDPFVTKKNLKGKRIGSNQSILFKSAFEEYCHFKNAVAKEWAQGTLDDHVMRFNKHILPVIGEFDVRLIQVEDLFGVLEDIQDAGGLTVLTKVSTVFRGMYSRMVGKNISGDKRYPALNIPNSIPQDYFIKQKEENYKHVTTKDEARVVVNKVYKMRGSFQIKQCLKILLHIFLRPGVMADLRWSEVRFDEGLIEIPAERMKMKKAFRIPMSEQVRDLLNELHTKTSHSEYVFLSPYRSGDNRPISRDSLTIALKKNGVVEITAHGFRHMASTMLRDELKCKKPEIEAQLAHVVGGVEGKYNKAQHFDERKKMMQKWSNYIEDLIEYDDEDNSFAGELFFGQS